MSIHHYKIAKYKKAVSNRRRYEHMEEMLRRKNEDENRKKGNLIKFGLNSDLLT